MSNSRRRNTRRGGAMTRKNRRNGIVSRLYSPLHHAFLAGEEAVSAVTNTARNVVSTGIRGVDRIGRSVTGHADGAVRNVFTRRRQGGGRRRRHSRKTKRSRRKAKRSRRN